MIFVIFKKTQKSKNYEVLCKKLEVFLIIVNENFWPVQLFENVDQLSANDKSLILRSNSLKLFMVF